MEELTGGREGSIYRSKDTVIRPINTWSSTVHLLLKHLHSQGFTWCPEFLGADGTTETLSFVEGETFNYPLVGAIATEAALASAAQLLRNFHDCSATFLQVYESSQLEWMLPIQEPQEVVCHGDFTPYNVALQGNEVIGIFDFDTAHPAPRVWDLAFSIYSWAPFKTDPIDRLGSLAEQIQRAKLFCDSYDASDSQRECLAKAMIDRLNALVSFIQAEAGLGNEQFKDDLAYGHHLGYIADIEYIRTHQKAITLGVMA